ncbi:MAG TPA: prepilin peptidase [Candidatus Saccharimonadales bacterium]|nr:prepilin peptidase [Candidatus Saccharimonadales bacterium]
MFEPKIWAQVPFPFWTACFFVFGCVVGSFLNVCIHRLPREESVVRPPSHCPHCGYSIPWYLNIPLVTWLWLRARCANCGREISARYFLVELLTGVVFAVCWLHFGHRSALVALVFCLMIAGLIVATFIDFEHYIIPDEITLGGTVVGFLLAFFVPASHLSFPFLRPMTSPGAAMRDSFLGIVVGGGVVYAVLRLGKLLFGRYRLHLTPGTRVLFTETMLKLPDREMPYEELFYRAGDTVRMDAEHVEMIDRCYSKAQVRLQPHQLQIGQDTFEPDKVPHLEAVADHIVLPREAMGLGDVKFMAAIGAFLGWRAVLFSLAASSVIGSLVVGALIALRQREWSTRLPYGPYIAVAAVIWVFGGYLLLKGLF